MARSTPEDRGHARRPGGRPADGRGVPGVTFACTDRSRTGGLQVLGRTVVVPRIGDRRSGTGRSPVRYVRARGGYRCNLIARGSYARLNHFEIERRESMSFMGSAPPPGILIPRWCVPILAASLLVACDGGPAGPSGSAQALLVFSSSVTSLGSSRSTSVVLRNGGTLALGPVELRGSPIRDPGGASVPGARLTVDPATLPTLNPGGDAEIVLGVQLPGTLQPGAYTTKLTARAGSDASTELTLGFRIALPESGAATIHLGPIPSTLRQGDVLGLTAIARDSAGAPMEGAPIAWRLEPPDGGFVGPTGAFVGYRPGPALLIGRAGGAADTAAVTIEERGRGELLGDLSRQGREIAALRYDDGPGRCDGGTTTCSWAPQLHDGLIYLSDLNSGLVILRPGF